MSSILEIYSAIHRSDTQGVQGYHVDNKYHDPLKLKQQRIIETSNNHSQTNRVVNISKKTTFIDEIQRQKAKFPGPTTYEPKSPSNKSKTESLVQATRRETIFDEMQRLVKKQNFPAAGLYDKVQVDTDKTRLRSDITKAQKMNYLDSSMRNSLDCPGVGNYNAHYRRDKRAAKWVNNPEKKSTSSTLKLPPVGTYSPLPVAYQLFQNQTANKRKNNRSCLGKQERFKKSKEKPLPFYNILSEWGMKNKHASKDILNRISSPSPRSVYH